MATTEALLFAEIDSESESESHLGEMDGGESCDKLDSEVQHSSTHRKHEIPNKAARCGP